MIIKDSQQARAVAAQTIRDGMVFAFRTDTFYGLGADPLNAFAVRRIRELKGREDTKPILLLISDASEVDRFLAHQTDLFRSVAKRFWPGPITLIGEARADLPEDLTAGTQTVGLRLPDDEDVISLVRGCGGALTATSANTSGAEPATSAIKAEQYFPGLMVLDGGEVTATQPSTVLQLTGPEPRLIREGAISRARLAEVITFPH